LRNELEYICGPWRLNINLMMKNPFCALFLAVSALLSFTSNAQISREDSLKGFNEKAFINSSASRGISGAELKSELTIAKKEHIYSNYYKPHINLAATPALPHVTVVQPACTNMDFETGTFYGWDLSNGTISNSQTMLGCCPTIGAPQSTIINTGAVMTDPIVPALSLASPFGGSYIARVNDSGTGAVVNRASQTFSVTSSNSVFKLAFAAVLNSAGNHACDTQPNINITVLDSANNVLACPFLAFSAPSAACPNSDPSWIAYGGAGGGHYRDWSIRTIDLQQYIGTAVTVQITVADCTASGHYGYAYFDMQCVPMQFTSNGNPYNISTQDSAYISTCGSASAVIGVPDGLGPYFWQGPATSTVTGATTSTISTNVSGTYTITMSPPGTCPTPGNPTGSIVKKAVLRISAAPTVSASATQPGCANASGTGQVNVTGGTGPFSYSWTPAASNSALNNGLTPGSTYTVVVTDYVGCAATATLAINPFPDAPTFTITPLNGVLTCASPSLMLSATTGTQTAAVWAGTTTRTLSVNAPGTYSVVLTNTASVGQCSTTVNVTVTSNTVQPTATYSLSCQSNTISLVATSQSGVVLGWLAPTLPNPSPVSNPGISSALGIYTLTATHLSTGCMRTYTASTIINLSVTPTATTICSGEQAILQAGVAHTYTWMPGAVSGAIRVVTPVSTTTYTVEGTLDGCNTVPATVVVTVAACTGLEERIGQTEVSVYPNPGSGVFTISSSANTPSLEATVINVLGQTIKTAHSNDPKSLVIDLSTFSKGVYYIKVQMNDGYKLLKVILE
jgi:hypothetical protein